MSQDTKLSLSLLILRLTIAAFFGVWSSLKFLRPSWFENIFNNSYGLEFISRDISWIFGSAQVVLVVVFAIGLWRTYSYGIILLMHTTGVTASIPSMLNYTSYPNNLMWTSIPALGAMLALWILRDNDVISVDGWRLARRATAPSS